MSFGCCCAGIAKIPNEGLPQTTKKVTAFRWIAGRKMKGWYFAHGCEGRTRINESFAPPSSVCAPRIRVRSASCSTLPKRDTTAATFQLPEIERCGPAKNLPHYYTLHGWLDRLLEPLSVQGLTVVRESLAAASRPISDSLAKDRFHEH